MVLGSSKVSFWATSDLHFVEEVQDEEKVEKAVKIQLNIPTQKCKPQSFAKYGNTEHWSADEEQPDKVPFRDAVCQRELTAAERHEKAEKLAESPKSRATGASNDGGEVIECGVGFG